MSGQTLLALGLAVLAALGYGIASVMQSVGAKAGSDTLGIFRQPLYLLGVGLDGLSWLVSLVALRTLAVYQVQAILAGSLAVTAIVARFALHAVLTRRDVVAVVAAIAALAVIAASAQEQAQAAPSGVVQAGIVAGAVLVVLLGVGVARLAHAPGCAVLGGLAFGGAALCARAVPLDGDPLHRPGAFVGALVTAPLSYALLAYGVAGMLLYAQALQHGAVGPMTALLWISEVVVPALIGVLLFGDRVRPGWAVATACAFVVSVAATFVLAVHPVVDEPT